MANPFLRNLMAGGGGLDLAVAQQSVFERRSLPSSHRNPFLQDISSGMGPSGAPLDAGASAAAASVRPGSVYERRRIDPGVIHYQQAGELNRFERQAFDRWVTGAPTTTSTTTTGTAATTTM